ncbi:hypothetical protein D9M70_633490 [compost metagenome]
MCTRRRRSSMRAQRKGPGFPGPFGSVAEEKIHQRALRILVLIDRLLLLLPNRGRRREGA